MRRWRLSRRSKIRAAITKHAEKNAEKITIRNVVWVKIEVILKLALQQIFILKA